ERRAGHGGGGPRKAPTTPKPSTASTSNDSTVKKSAPLCATTYRVSTAKPAMKMSETARMSDRISMLLVHRIARGHRFSPLGKQVDERESEQKATDMGEVGDTPASPGRVGYVGRAVEHLDHEPQAEHYERRQFDHRDEEDDEHQREYPSLGEQEDVAAQHGGDGP